MVNWRHEKNRRTPRRLERVAQTPRVGTLRARMETERDCGGAGSQPRGCEPMDEGGTRARGRGMTRENSSGASTPTKRRTDGAASHPAGARSRGLWVSRSCLDDAESGRADQTAVWRELSSSAHESTKRVGSGTVCNTRSSGLVNAMNRPSPPGKRNAGPR